LVEFMFEFLSGLQRSIVHAALGKHCRTIALEVV